MANHDFKIGDRVHHSKCKPTKGYDCFIAGFSKDGESVVLGNVEGGHNGKDTSYLHNENGDYVGYSLLTKALGYYFVDTEGLRKLTDNEKTSTMLQNGKVYLLKDLGFGRERYYGYTEVQSKEIDNQYVVVTDACSDKSNTAIILTGKNKGKTYFLHSDDLTSSCLTKTDFPYDDQKFFEKDYKKSEDIRKGGAITKRACDGTTVTIKTTTEKAVILLNNNSTLTVNQNY